jgi:hypothetical protein
MMPYLEVLQQYHVTSLEQLMDIQIIFSDGEEKMTTCGIGRIFYTSKIHVWMILLCLYYLLILIKSYISNLVLTTQLWKPSNIHHVPSKSNNWKVKYFKNALRVRNQKGLNRIARNRSRLPMIGGDEALFNITLCRNWVRVMVFNAIYI